MNILILGSGGREDALQWAIAKSTDFSKVYINPGNALTFNNVTSPLIREFIEFNKIDLVVVGPETFLAYGIVDEIQDIVEVIGPTKHAARLETDKLWAKEFMVKYDIPTPSFSTEIDIKSFPVIIKSSGLAFGKGVFVCKNSDEASFALKEVKKYDKPIIIEEFIDGKELSYFIFVKNNKYVVLPEAMDYKQIGDKDTGLNTGGMGAISPIDFCTAELREKIENKIVKPTIDGLKKEGIDYCGFIYFGLMISNNEPYLLEYNCRLGDPEAQVILPRINDFLSVLTKQEIEINDDYCVGVVVSVDGYPSNPKLGDEVTIKDGLIFGAGIKVSGEKLVTCGGRVATVVGRGKTREDAVKNAYKDVENVNFAGKYYRKDIGTWRFND